MKTLFREKKKHTFGDVAPGNMFLLNKGTDMMKAGIRIQSILARYNKEQLFIVDDKELNEYNAISLDTGNMMYISEDTHVDMVDTVEIVYG